MKDFSTTDVQRHLGDVTDAARKSPVFITHHRKKKFVLMSTDHYETMVRLADPRRAYRTADTPPELARELTAALDALIESLPDDS
jgi:prevent-host-death family protein